MKLIADSGSTKTDWRMIDPNGRIAQFTGAGLNPYFYSDAQLRESLTKLADELKGAIHCHEIYFYGAGLGEETQRHRLKEAIESIFTSASRVEIASDMLAAVRASAGREPGIVGILGTGANACYSDGQVILAQSIAPGFILGDEGSGSWLGRKAIQSWLRKEWPDELLAKFEYQYSLSVSEVYSKVYSGEKPNTYLASFVPFLAENKKHPAIHGLLRESFELFVRYYLKPIAPDTPPPIFLVGSVAWNFQDVIAPVIKDSGFSLGRILPTPIAGLTLYHQHD